MSRPTRVPTPPPPGVNPFEKLPGMPGGMVPQPQAAPIQVSSHRRTVHMNYLHDFLPLSQVAPDMPLVARDKAGEEHPVHALVFVVEGEMHVFCVDPDRKADLIRKMTGGIEVAS